MAWLGSQSVSQEHWGALESDAMRHIKPQALHFFRPPAVPEIMWKFLATKPYNPATNDPGKLKLALPKADIRQHLNLTICQPIGVSNEIQRNNSQAMLTMM